MNSDPLQPIPYEVSYSERVYTKLLELAGIARQRGDGEQFLNSFREFHRRLCIYPQFGDPLMDLQEHHGQIRIGIIPPLAIRYTVFEEKRFVFVGALPVLLAQQHS